MPDDSANSPCESTRTSHIPLDRWKQIVSALPDVRLHKVLATRRALRQNRYDGEHVLDKTIQHLSSDLELLLRNERGSSPI